MSAEDLRRQVAAIEERLRTADIYLMGAENELQQALQEVMLVAIGSESPDMESALRIGPLIASDINAGRMTLLDMRERIAEYRGKI